MQQLAKRQVVYYARIIETVGIYEVLELKIRTIEDTYFVGTDKSTRHAYLLSNSYLGKLVFKDRQAALKVVKEAEKNRKVISEETYYEED